VLLKVSKKEYLVIAYHATVCVFCLYIAYTSLV